MRVTYLALICVLLSGCATFELIKEHCSFDILSKKVECKAKW